MGRVSSLAEARARRTKSERGEEAGLSVPSDDELVRAIERGDGRLAGHLHERLEPAVGGAVRRLLGPRSPELEDVVQTAYERIVSSLKRGTFQAGNSLEAWAAVIATRTGMDHLRSVYRRRRFFSDVEPPDAGTKDASAKDPAGERAIELQRVRRALSSLKPKHAEVLFLHDAMGYDLREIAEQLDITVAAAQSRLVRTRKELLLRLKRQDIR